jgi:hypothetical protein
MNAFAQIVVRHGVDLKTFDDEIRAAGKPVVLEDAVAHWPIVAAGRQSAQALADHIRQFDRGIQVPTIEVPHSQGGRLFYREDMSGFNFCRISRPRCPCRCCRRRSGRVCGWATG